MPRANQAPRWSAYKSWLVTVTVLVGLVSPVAAYGAGDTQIVGAGSSFAAPVIQLWGAEVAKEYRVDVQYRSVGSGEGIRRAAARSVDFAITDLPLTQADLAHDDLVQYPLVAGAIVPVANLPEIQAGVVHLSGAALADIFLGRITSWDAPALRALNPGLELPNTPIKVVHRADGSGTTFVFTYYLSKVSPEWDQRLGIGSRVPWPVGTGASGNEGVAQEVSDTVGAIGYVEYAYVLKSGLMPISLSNRMGRVVSPRDQGVRAALAGTRFSRSSYYEVAVDRDGENSWPIVGVSYVLISRNPPDVEAARKALLFFDWIYRRGSPLGQKHHYVVIDDEALIGRIKSSWKDIRDRSGQSIWKNK